MTVLYWILESILNKIYIDSYGFEGELLCIVDMYTEKIDIPHHNRSQELHLSMFYQLFRELISAALVNVLPIVQGMVISAAFVNVLPTVQETVISAAFVIVTPNI